MTEARYRGQKVVAVAPDYADNVKFADEWLPASPGTDGALAMAMGHVILKEFFVDRRDAVLRRLRQAVHRPAVPGPRSTTAERRGVTGRASSSPPPTSPTTPARRTPPSRPCCSTPRTGEPVVPERLARAPLRRGRRRASGTSTSATSTRRCRLLDDAERDAVLVELPRFDTPDGAAGELRRGVPVRRVGGHLVTTVFDLLLAQYGVAPRRACPGSGPRRTTTPTRRTPRPGRSRSPASRPRPRRGSGASSRRTPRSPTAAR